MLRVCSSKTIAVQDRTAAVVVSRRGDEARARTYAVRFLHDQAALDVGRVLVERDEEVQVADVRLTFPDGTAQHNTPGAS